MQGKPLPNINGDNREFWTGCRGHQLKFQKCGECGHIRWPAALVCPVCHSQKAGWVMATGKGKIYTFVVYRVAYHPAFTNDLPYIVAVVEMEEGPRLLTNIVGCRPEDVACEMAVETVWKDVSDEISLPLFKLSKGSDLHSTRQNM